MVLIPRLFSAAQERDWREVAGNSWHLCGPQLEGLGV